MAKLIRVLTTKAAVNEYYYASENRLFKECGTLKVKPKKEVLKELGLRRPPHIVLKLREYNGNTFFTDRFGRIAKVKGLHKKPALAKKLAAVANKRETIYP